MHPVFPKDTASLVELATQLEVQEAVNDPNQKDGVPSMYIRTDRASFFEPGYSDSGQDYLNCAASFGGDADSLMSPQSFAGSASTNLLLSPTTNLDMSAVSAAAALYSPPQIPNFASRSTIPRD